jgi:hypothetical protein
MILLDTHYEFYSNKKGDVKYQTGEKVHLVFERELTGSSSGAIKRFDQREGLTTQAASHTPKRC